VYFGTAWQLLNEDATASPITIGGGYANMRIERTSDGLFFAGIVEKLRPNGTVSDVILAFAGAQGAADLVQGETLAQGIVLDEPKRAAALFESLWREPRYANARIHVTGHSLGAGYSQFVGAEAVATHGLSAVTARVDILSFGVPNWGPQSARFYGIPDHAIDPLFTGYTALNDPVITNGGTDRVGISNFLPPFTGLPLVYSALNSVAAHWPTTYITALGLPGWLGNAEQAAVISALNAQFVTKNSYDPNYGPAGTLPLIVQGGAGADTVTGSDGDDMIVGLGGQDILRGGAGLDRFMFVTSTDSGTTAEAADRIVDFQPGDRIDFSRMDADSTRLGTQSFSLVAGRNFSRPGQIATWTENGETWVAGNIDADPAADFLIRVNGIRTLTAGDFVFGLQSTDQKIAEFVGQNQSILYPYLVGNPLLPTIPAL
jgi:hypothetical protein